MSPPFLLIVTRHYPPEISGGARRPFLLAKGLRERGWRVAIASPFAPEGEPDWIRTPHPAAERGRAAAEAAQPRHEPGWKSWTRRMVRWPDNEIGWAGQAVRAIMASGLRPDWVLTTSPPESAHAAGERLKRALGVRWALEMRDSWIEEPLRPELAAPGFRRKVEQGIAARWLAAADARIAVSDALAAEMQRLAPRAASLLSVIGHFADPPPAPFRFEGEGPHLLHSGSFSLSHAERKVGALLAAFGTLRSAYPTARLHLAGRLTALERAEIFMSPHADSITLHGELPYTDARALQAGADALILYQQGIDALPGKLAEYLECTAPILTLGEGPWKSRLKGIPNWPIGHLGEALESPRRSAAATLARAIHHYDTLLRG
jgi:glycosyltransferase involved in cell wall biosynthesis